MYSKQDLFRKSGTEIFPHLEPDLLVAGGGMAGVCCALEAARSGVKVLLVQDRSVLGGNASSEIRMHICGADGMRGKVLETEAREGGIIEEIRLESSLTNPQRSASLFDLLLYDFCRRESNLTLLLNTSLIDVCMDGNRILSVLLERRSTEDLFRVTAKQYVDATGDGILGKLSGADFKMGREGLAECNESLAPVEKDEKTLGSSLLYMAKKWERPMPYDPPDWARKFTSEDLRLRPIGSSRGLDCGYEYGFWWCEWGGQRNTITDNEEIRDELLAILTGIWDHVKNSGHYPGSANWALDWIGFLPGKRESRRLLGPYFLTQKDIFKSPSYPDTIAYGGWPIDTHPPEGVDAPDEPPCVQTEPPFLFEIPLRACFSRNIHNLFFAGRNISASHIAFAATRVMATCSVVGQGVGAAAAYCIQHQLTPAEAVDSSDAMFCIQQNLLRHDCYLPGILNQDPKDLARQAEISASSSLPGAEANQIVSGQTRSVHGEKGTRPDIAVPGLHRWMSNPSEEMPQWIELQWKTPVAIGTVELVFDSGLHNRFTLTMADAFAEPMKWGAPRPAVVRDYDIDFFDQTGVRIAGEAVTGNFQRRRIHAIKALGTVRLRVTVRAANGSPDARICEVRCYGH